MFIQSHQQVTAVHELCFFRQDLRDDTGRLCRHRHQVTGNIGVVGPDPKPIVGVPIHEVADGGDQDQQSDDQ